MIYDVKKDHRPVRKRVEAPVKRCQVETVQVGDPVSLTEVGGDELLANDIGPLPICPNPSNGRLETLPDRLSRLHVAKRQLFPGRVRHLKVRVDCNGIRPKRHAGA
jgi:hypothetical protein